MSASVVEVPDDQENNTTGIYRSTGYEIFGYTPHHTLVRQRL